MDEYNKKKLELKNFLEIGLYVFLAVAATYFLLMFVGQRTSVHGNSMYPTLKDGDQLIVEKVTKHFSSPKRFDIIVFNEQDEKSDETVHYIKRVIGLPGDKIEYINKKLSINGKPVPIGEIGEYYDEAKMQSLEEFLEKLDKTEHHLLINPRAPSSVYPLSTHTDPKACDYVPGGLVCMVPKDKYFVMGDNRDNSEDSRYWGFVPEKNLVGRAFMVWMNVSKPSRIGFFN